jgi:hypothetical protein
MQQQVNNCNTVSSMWSALFSIQSNPRLHNEDQQNDPSSCQKERPTSTSLQLSDSNKDLVLSPRWVLYSKTDWLTDRWSLTKLWLWSWPVITDSQWVETHGQKGVSCSHVLRTDSWSNELAVRQLPASKDVSRRHWWHPLPGNSEWRQTDKTYCELKWKPDFAFHLYAVYMQLRLLFTRPINSNQSCT